MPKFILQQGYADRQEIDIPTGPLIIGRDRACDVVLAQGSVSRQHARVERREQRVKIEDLQSQNGTFLNGAPLQEAQALKHMDTLQIGENIFVFREDEGVERPSDTGKSAVPAGYNLDFLKALVRRLEGNVKEVFKGDETIVRNVLVALLADGHVLLEDAPGVGKSILAQSVAKSVRGVYKRIQFTPDMLPSDVTGVNIYNNTSHEFTFSPGPVFGNIILADEINRTTPRTQSSLLECMNDATVTIDGTGHVLPKPFFVLATQNPAEFQGTYPLPEAQLDRFLMRLSIGYPTATVEREILDSQEKGHPLSRISYVATTNDIVQCQALVRQVHVAESVKDYIVHIAQATRAHPALSIGCSPRASLALMRAAQGLAAYLGRDYILPKDVRELATPVLAHRVGVKLRAQVEWRDPAEIIRAILEEVPVAHEEELG